MGFGNGIYDVIVGNLLSFIQVILCSSIGERYFLFSLLGIQKSIACGEGIITPLCSRVVKSEFVVGVCARVIPAFSQPDRKDGIQYQPEDTFDLLLKLDFGHFPSRQRQKQNRALQMI